METKKSKRADLEPKKSIFLQIGIVVALGLTLAAFEWESPVKQIVVTDNWETVGEDLFIKNTVIVDTKPAPKPVSIPVINIVDNDDPVGDPFDFDMGIKPEDEIPVYIPPVSVELKDENSLPDDTPFVSVQIMPEYPGGIDALKAFLASKINFPENAARAGIEGTVYVYFVVERDGTVSNIKTLRGINDECDEEAERVIGLLPKWKPGVQQGKSVRVSFTIPVGFKLQ
jgi:periplasmic protein TonB